MGTNEKMRKANVHQALGLGLVAILVVIGLYAYVSRWDRPATISVAFMKRAGGATPQFDLEVAADEAHRAKGLMFRKPGEMKEDQGMIFIFPEEKRRIFWMKDTYLPLDILFLDRNLKVVGVLENVPPLNPVSRSVDTPSKYVVELLGGTATKQGISAGAVLRAAEPLPAAR